MVISLNAIDETARKGIWIDSAALSRRLGVPVVESIAVSGLGTKQLKAAVKDARVGKCPVSYGQIIDRGISSVASALPQQANFKRKTAILLLLDDPYLTNHLTKEYGPKETADLAEKV